MMRQEEIIEALRSGAELRVERLFSGRRSVEYAYLKSEEGIQQIRVASVEALHTRGKIALARSKCTLSVCYYILPEE